MLLGKLLTPRSLNLRRKTAPSKPRTVRCYAKRARAVEEDEAILSAQEESDTEMENVNVCIHAK